LRFGSDYVGVDCTVTPGPIPWNDRFRGYDKFDLAKRWLEDSLKASGISTTGRSGTNLTALRISSSVSRQKPLLPSRVLYLGEKGVDPKGDLKLECNTTGKRADYFTLSYRWGKSEPFTTTKESESARCTEIRFRDMPNTLKDAVEVTRRMGCRYLWIDALCILQDSLEDWKKESQNMGNIYRDSLCTIAAHCAKSSSDGFLAKAIHSSASPVKVRARTSPNGPIEKFESFIRMPGDFKTQVDEGHLSKRGWVLQERVLSTRILHFAEEALFWEDAEGVKCENGDLLDITEELQNGSNSRRRMKPDVSQFGVKDWYEWVERYARCDLTNESDKLPAIAGIANVMIAYTKRPYFAGLWMDHLQYGLIWNPVSPLHRPAYKRAPSWSWASFDGQVEYSKKFATSVSEMKFIGISERPGGVGTASLLPPDGPSVLEIQTAVRTISHGSRLENSGCDPTEAGPCSRTPGHYCSFRLVDESVKELGGWIGTVAFDDSEDRGGNEFPKDVVCARIGSHEGKPGYSMLVLARTHKFENEFRRVGMGSVSHPGWFNDAATISLHIV